MFRQGPHRLAVLGPSAGHGALVAPVCDFTVMSGQARSSPPAHRWKKSRQVKRFPKRISADRMWRCAAGDPQFRRVRRGRARRDPALPVLLPSSAWSYPPTRPSTTTPLEQATPNCSTSFPATTGGSTTCERSSTRCSTTPTGWRSSRGSVRRSSARWPISAAIRSRWSPTSHQLAGVHRRRRRRQGRAFHHGRRLFHLPSCSWPTTWDARQPIRAGGRIAKWAGCSLLRRSPPPSSCM